LISKASQVTGYEDLSDKISKIRTESKNAIQKYKSMSKVNSNVSLSKVSQLFIENPLVFQDGKNVEANEIVKSLETFSSQLADCDNILKYLRSSTERKADDIDNKDSERVRPLWP
jgi:hypothetical protein